ncbi:MAG: DUF2147 domain-containing protein [Ignavibacteria bacterium]|nr:DUF2147 domain-containing protein [Ignavibacteria bacterium]
MRSLTLPFVLLATIAFCFVLQPLEGAWQQGESAIVCRLFPQSPVEGSWLTGEDSTIIKIYQKDGSLFGKILSSDNPNVKIGTEILQGFRLVKGVWTGKLWEAKRSELLDATLELHKNVLEIAVPTGSTFKKLVWKKKST